MSRTVDVNSPSSVVIIKGLIGSWARPLLSLCLVCGLIGSIPMAYGQSLRDQIEQAVNQGQWEQALSLIDQMIQAQPQHRETLESYRARLIQLQQEQSSGSSSTQTSGSGDPQPVQQPLPPGLDRHAYYQPDGDYFSEIRSYPRSGVYRRWTRYPVSVYIPRDTGPWFDLVEAAVDEWTKYVPLTITSFPDAADIVIKRDFQVNNAVDGNSKAESYVAEDGRLQQRVEITLKENPKTGFGRTTAFATRELGRALGLWGDSDRQEDIMYDPMYFIPEITPRDLNTLKRVYEQPTMIGVQVPPDYTVP